MAAKNVTIVRDGTQIIIPAGMPYQEARDWLTRQEQAEEKVVAIADEIPCYPLDGMVAVMRAIKEVYGFADLRDTPTFFGSNPPRMIQVPMFDGTFETAVLGRIAVPTWEGGVLDTHVSDQPKMILTGQIKRKFEAEVKKIITLTREKLKEQSIYKSTAITVDLAWMENEQEFHPIDNAPKFMDVKNVTESMLILNEVTSFELSANIYTLIEQTAACRRNNIPLKHGCLLMGPFGTGKTLAARVLAAKCVKNGWTFIYLKHAKHLADGLRLAELYAPAVVFAEDIDQIMGGDRDEAMNMILNTIDGVDTKDKPIITILTTNNPLSIEPAFLRAGRIDTVIEMDAPDAKTAIRFVHQFAVDQNKGSLLVKDANLTEAGKELAGFVPAFIAEAVQKAKRFAIHREGTDDIAGKVTGKDVVLAAQALRKHIALVNRKSEKTDEKYIADAVRLIEEYSTEGTIERDGNGTPVLLQ